jgi:dienelactone hydrolase
MDTLEGRWAKLWPHVLQYGPPDDRRRPAVILIHGCGGPREHLKGYAAAAVRAGWRAFLIDSYSARGWSRKVASHFVCVGLAFRGLRRSGDVLAAAWGVQRLKGVDPERLCLAGWSHGAWAIMDLMTLRLTRPGEAFIANPDPSALDGVKSLFLAYPYLNILARSRDHVWRRSPRTFAIVPRRDHLASVRTHMRAYASAVAAGAEFEIWPVQATHAFDEPGLKTITSLMRHDPDLQEAAIGKFKGFLASAR